MALYSYQAFSKTGTKVTGTLDASSPGAAREQLGRQGLLPISVTLASKAGAGFTLKNLFARTVPIKDKIIFTKQLTVLLKSGAPLLQALEQLVDQFEGKLHSILVDLKDGIREGASLADGLQKYPKVFPTVYVQLVRAGEATGKLEVILERLTEYLERTETLRKKVRGALFQPMMQLCIVALVVVFLLTVVVPKMAQAFERQGATLPRMTRIMMGLSSFVQNYYLLIGIAIVAIVILFSYWKSTPRGALLLDRIKLKIPIVKYFTRMGAVVQFCRTLGMLVEGGVNLAESLDIVCKIIDNQVLAQSLYEAREKIIKQGKIAQYLKQSEVFPSIAIYLIRTGEESGKLDYMLLTVAQNYETELQEYADGLAAALEPIMLIVMAVIVGFIVMAIAQPIVQMTQLHRR